MSTPIRAVVDTNILLRGLLNMRSAAGRVVELCDNRSVVILLSKRVLAEYRDVLTDYEVVARYPELSAEKVEIALARLRYVGDIFRNSIAPFNYPRDPGDEMLIELAIDGRATHIISADKDLLSLPHARTDAGKRFRQRAPRIRVVDAATFLKEWDFHEQE